MISKLQQLLWSSGVPEPERVPYRRFQLRWKDIGALVPVFILLFSMSSVAQRSDITGMVKDGKGQPLELVSIAEKGTTNGTYSDAQGKFTLNTGNRDAILVFSFIGYNTQEIQTGNKTLFEINMVENTDELQEVVVVGYSSKTKESLTGAITTVTSKDLDRVQGGSTVSSGLAGKLAGASFRMPDGRPGSSARVQIRNMGTPLYVIDGIQQDEGQFNNLAPNDIESITILKDASAAIYGVRAANGVVVVTTKRGSLNTETRINIDAYTGVQNWTAFPRVVNNSVDFLNAKAAAEVISFGKSTITPELVQKYRDGNDPAFRSFDWRNFIVQPNAPQTSINGNVTGGSDKVSYYLSATRLDQNSILGREYKFGRTNFQSNVTAKVARGLKVSVQLGGRIETTENPGVPGGDDYNLARQALYLNTPLDRPYANDNPNYLQDNGNKTNANWAFLNTKISGKLKSDWRVLQGNFSADYDVAVVPGLKLRGIYSYYIADRVLNNHEYTFDAFTYRPESDTYDRTNGSTNPWREREQVKQINTTSQLQASYAKKFGEHNVAATFVAERLATDRTRNWIHSVPTTNALPLIYFPTADRYDDSQDLTARIGYVGQVSYSYADRYYIDVSGRRDASYLFAPDKRIGYFPSVSAGWRLTNEPFFKNLIGKNSVIYDLKLRGSYGILGDDQNLVGNFSYLEGYQYNVGTAILGGQAVVGSRDRGVPITNISWLRSTTKDIGVDVLLFGGKFNMTADYFHRLRSGLLAVKTDIVVPTEIGYSLPRENLNTDSQYGGEISMGFREKIGEVNLSISGNIGYSRAKSNDIYKPSFNNSWDQYRNSGVDRYREIGWGYEAIGQFKTQDEISNYPVNIDGKGNRTLLPGDIIYKDLNGDGKLDGYDERPIAYGFGQQPNVNFGFSIVSSYKAFDIALDFSGASGYSWNQNWETRWAFQNNGSLNTIFNDSWKLKDPYDINSGWNEGNYPVNRYNVGRSHSNYDKNSTYWYHNVKYLRMRTAQIGYTVPQKFIEKIKLKKLRVYINSYNLLTFSNLNKYNVDPEVQDDNGLQFPQNKYVNVGINLSL